MSDEPSDKISSELVGFIREHFRSVRQLEVLVFLYSRAETGWNAEQIARSLCCNANSTANWLEEFSYVGFVVKENLNSYRYQPSDKKTAALITELVSEFRVRHLRVIDIIVNQPTRKMMDLLEAFRFKRGGSDDDS